MAETPTRRMSSLIMDVSSFLLWFDPEHVQGGVTAEQAFDSFCELLQLPKGRITNIVRGEPQSEELADDRR